MKPGLLVKELRIERGNALFSAGHLTDEGEQLRCPLMVCERCLHLLGNLAAFLFESAELFASGIARELVLMCLAEGTLVFGCLFVSCGSGLVRGHSIRDGLLICFGSRR